jgi:hypothetical protein
MWSPRVGPTVPFRFSELDVERCADLAGNAKALTLGRAESARPD